MKIVYINTIDNVGGAALFAWHLGRQMKKLGHDVRYLVGFKKSNDKSVYQLKNNHFLNLLADQTNIDVNFIFRGLFTKFLSNDIDYGAKEEILNHPWYQEADIVHCNNLHGNYFQLETLAHMSYEKKIVWTLHDEWAVMPHGSCIERDRVVNGFFHRRDLSTYPAMIWDNEDYLATKKSAVYMAANFQLVVPSLWLKRIIDRSLLKDKPIRLIHHGIDTGIFKRSRKKLVRQRLNIPQDKKVVLFVADTGSRNPLKGWSYVEQIMEHYKDNSSIYFVCIGGSTADERKTTFQTRYVSYVSDGEQLAQYYSAADVFLMTSLVESFSLVTVEAMACGLPVVAFPVGVVPELISHQKNGYLARYMDVADLIKGTEFMLQLPTIEVKKISDATIQLIHDQFSLGSMAKKYLKLYKELLAENE